MSSHLKPHQFKPGQSGNPEGGKKHNKQIKKIRHLTQDQIAEIGGLLLGGKLSDLQDVAKDPKSPALKVWFASIIINGIKRGDPNILNAFLDRVVGKVADKIQSEHIHLVNEIKRIELMSDEDLIAQAVEAIEVLKDETSVAGGDVVGSGTDKEG
jgi:hypothetical protein